MAEGLAKKKLYPLYKGKIKIHSAGTLGISNSPATPLAIAVAKEKGIDISAHLSKGINAQIVNEADIVLVMADLHRNFLFQNFPETQRKLHLLTNFALPQNEQKNAAVRDPIGENLAFYRRVISQLDRELERILPELKKQIDKKLS
jgi:protein-tyrosine phosphatase